MFKSLYARLALVLVGIVCAAGAILLVSLRHTVDRYQQEVAQKLNRELAAHIVAEQPLMRGGRADRRALETLFHHVMVINPAVEIYLLDPSGAILGYSAPPEKVQRKQVSLAPIRSFIEGRAQLPLQGDDPRDPQGRKIFSAAPIGNAAAPQGYVYAILAGQDYDNIAALARGSVVARIGMLTLGAVLVVALAAALLLFFVLTRRLSALSRAVEHFRAGGFRDSVPVPACTGGDELARLHDAFANMATQIRRQMQALEGADRMRRELVANVSHDLRTPLAALRGYLETLQLHDVTLTPEERERYLDSAIRHSDRLTRLVAELFELARLDANEVKLNLELFAPAELVQDVAQSYELSAQKCDIRIETLLDPQAPPVRADIALIQRALGNLLDNALRHTPAGGLVRVSLASVAGRVRVEVADSGRGIAPEDLPHVFSRFYRGRDDPRPQSDGAGLGLAIVKRILELHDAPVEVDSTPGHGARFAFNLPADERVTTP